MRTLLVPCAGERRIAGTPLIMLKHPKDGRYLFEWVIDGIYPFSYDRIIYVIRKETDNEYGLSELIREKLSKIMAQVKIEILVLDKATSGAAETVYTAINRCHIRGEIAIKDSHTYILLSEACHGNFIASLDMTVNLSHINDFRNKSFIVTNEQGQILDVIEKRFRSDVISTGLYGFKDASDFVYAYRRLSDGSYPISKLYVSHIISYLLGYKERVFHTYEVEKFEEWGTDSIWSALQRKYANYYLDMSSLFGDDIQISESVKSILKSRSERGASFIAIIEKPMNGRDIMQELTDIGVNCAAVIYGCNKSQENFFIQNLADLEKRGL